MLLTSAEYINSLRTAKEILPFFRYCIHFCFLGSTLNIIAITIIPIVFYYLIGLQEVVYREGRKIMLFFGHIGITAGIVQACDTLVSMSEPDNSYEPDSSSIFGLIIHKRRLCLHHLLSGIKGRIGSIDYRIVLLGSLLPDMIDKPLWLFAAGYIAPSGRGYAHTLLFNLALFICGLILFRYRKSWLLLISLCSFMHLIFDQIWNSPVVLLWPLLGPIPEEETAGWLFNIIKALFSQPSEYIPEIIGLIIILLFAYRLVIRRSIISFIKGGAV